MLYRGRRTPRLCRRTFSTGTLSGTGSSVCRCWESHAVEAFARYFRGHPPFRAVKHREDLPDGFVFAAAKDVVSSSRPLHCVCSDSRLRDALATLPDCTVHQTFEALLQTQDMVAARSTWEAERIWQSLKASISYERVEEEAADFIQEHIGQFVEGKEVESPLIPDETNTARLQMYGSPESITFVDREDWGAGWLSLSTEFFVTATVEFLIYRSDAYDTAPEISVSFGDPEEDHYFDASAEVRIKVSATLAVK